MKIRLSFLTALLCIIAFTSNLRASPSGPIGAVLQGSHYDSEKQMVTFNLVNTSHKDITAYSLSVRASFPDGTAGTWSYGGDSLPHIAQMGTGALAPGAVKESPP